MRASLAPSPNFVHVTDREKKIRTSRSVSAARGNAIGQHNVLKKLFHAKEVGLHKVAFEARISQVKHPHPPYSEQATG